MNFNLAEEAQIEGAKLKKRLKNITLITNLPLFVGTGSTIGGENLSQLFGVKIVVTIMYLGPLWFYPL